ncbi:MAG: DUF2064 domain-containing protein [Saprospiraceae bacterium]|nr:DUF2064 domain-containing protein [Saprospiraceae bacterium]
MSARSTDTAILVFSRTARSEAAAKTFSARSGKAGNEAIAQRLIAQTLATARQTKLPVLLHYTTQADHKAFGERLAAAVESAFTKGYTRLIVVGNDSPDLSAALLLDAADQLHQHPLVLGPAADGGVYLIGIQEQAFHRYSFVALPWNSAVLQHGWLTYPGATAIWLPALPDLDFPDDVACWLSRSPSWAPLAQQLRSILAGAKRPEWLDRTGLCLTGAAYKPQLRGPPC